MKFRILFSSLIGTTAASAIPHGSSSSSSSSSIAARGESITRILLSGPGGLALATVGANGTGIDIRARQNPTGDPSWVTFRAPDTVFALDENGAELTALRVDLDAYTFTPASKFPGSSGLVHLALARDGKRLLGAAYGNGSIDAWNVENPAAVKRIANVPLKGTPGPNKERQAASHPHQVVVEPGAGRYAAVPDLGFDAVHVIDTADDAFKVVNSVRVEPAGCGPRHVVFYPPAPATTATHMIVLCEIANLINVYAIKNRGGDKGLDMSLVQSLSSFGPGVAHPKAAAGEIALGPDGKDVYVSNRLTEDADDHIAHFRVSANATAACDNDKKKDGKTKKRRGADAAGGLALQFVGQQRTHGQNPRMFSLTADGALVFVANGKGEAGVWGIERNKDTGVLGPAPLWSLPMTAFNGQGPQYIQQIQ